ncbi:MAG: hypothetical protein ACREAM_25575 [Blastocatellia bacterium]
MLVPSGYGTFEIIVDGAGPEEIESLIELADERGLAAEDWSANIRMLCKACSEGGLASEHTHDADQTSYRRIGFAALSEIQANEVLQTWLATKPRAKIEEINCMLEPAFIN